MKERLLKICLALGVFLISAELLSVGWYWHIHREFFYKRNTRKETTPDQAQMGIPVLRFHPFFGFVDRTNLNVVNKQGFYSPYEFPYSRRVANEYIIAITGGSVAARVELTGTQQRMIDVLKRSPYFRDKPITVLNFAMGAYKQPQQLIALTYFLSIGQQIDLLVNIDGFNEVALSSLNHKQSVDIFMPSADIMRPLLDIANQAFLSAENLQTLANISRHKLQLFQIRTMMDHCNFASKYFVLEQWERLVLGKYHRQIEMLTKSKYKETEKSIVYLPPMNEKIKDEVLYEEIAQQWANSLLLMKVLLESKQIKFFSVVQPNQYFSKKVLTAEERKVAFKPDGPGAAGVQKGYPSLLKQFDFLKERGVNVSSAVNIFDDVRETLYIDDCCHFNELGHEMLSEFIAQEILNSRIFEDKPEIASVP